MGVNSLGRDAVSDKTPKRLGLEPNKMLLQATPLLTGADWMRCLRCGSAAVTERPERTAQGYRQFRCRECGSEGADEVVREGVQDKVQRRVRLGRSSRWLRAGGGSGGRSTHSASDRADWLRAVRPPARSKIRTRNTAWRRARPCRRA